MLDFFSSTYGATLIQIAILNLIATISPGQNFAIIVRSSIMYERRIGIMTAIGVILGELVHITYIILGIGVILAHAWILSSIKILGCLYLSYLGVRMLCAKKNMGGDLSQDADSIPEQAAAKSSPSALPSAPISGFKALWTGVLTNLCNFNVVIFLLSLFSVVVDSGTPAHILMLYSGTILLTSFTWFILVVFLFSNHHIRALFSSASHWVERFTGGVLLVISIKLALTKEY